MAFWHLRGDSSLVTELPVSCVACGKKQFFRQPDFNRSVGVWIVAFAAILTCVLLVKDVNWWWVYSPLFFAAIIDRVCSWTRSYVLVCYQCGHIFRGLSKTQMSSVDEFDLELSDRIHYADTNSQ